MMRSDLRLPLALVNVVLAGGGRLGGAADEIDPALLQDLVAQVAEGNAVSSQAATGDDQQVEVSEG
jgi:hypothetical protein